MTIDVKISRFDLSALILRKVSFLILENIFERPKRMWSFLDKRISILNLREKGSIYLFGFCTAITIILIYSTKILRSVRSLLAPKKFPKCSNSYLVMSRSQAL